MERLAIIVYVAAIPLLGMIACDDDQTPSINPVPTTQQTETRSPEETASGPSAGMTKGPDDTQLAQRAALFEQADFRAAYTFSISTQEGSTSGTLTWYQKRGKARGDFTGMVGTENVEVIVIPGPGYPSEEFLYVCRPQQETCSQFRLEDEQQGYGVDIGLIVLGSVLLDGREFSEAVYVTATSKRTVAGEEAECFQGTGVEGASIETGEVCLTADGIALAGEKGRSGERYILGGDNIKLVI